jgi:CheY-like chemotaxis protein
LIIDDEPYVRAALQRVLEPHGLEVETAGDADAGIASLARAPADLVIGDVVLPGLDGVKAITQIRALYPDIRIIAISGGGNFGLHAYRPEAISTRAYLAASKLAGADAVLAKPFETQELRELMTRAVEFDVAPERLAALGAEHGHPEWTAAAGFIAEYLDVVGAARPNQLDQAELSRFAAAAIRSGAPGPRVEGLRLVVVDDFQEATEASFAVLRALAFFRLI